MLFICELLKQNIDKSAIVLQKISDNDINMVIYLYELFHIIHAMVSIFKIIRIKRNIRKYPSHYYITIFL